MSAGVAAPLAFSVACALGAAWGTGALWFKFADGTRIGKCAAMTWLVACAALLLLAWSGHVRVAAATFVLAFAALLVWWASLRAAGTRDWNDDVARISRGSIEGRRVRLEDVRAFNWRSRTDYDARWVDRVVDLDRLVSLDMVLSYWAGPAIAHTLVSFGFADAPVADADAGTVPAARCEFITFTVEIRRRRGQAFSEIGGFFRLYELAIVAAEERDVVGVRTNVRGEDDWLFRIDLPPAQIRSLFLAYVEAATELTRRPRFYNTITANCTTIIYQMVTRIVGRLPLSPRLLLSGYLPEYVQAIDGFAAKRPVAELRRLGRITDRARAAPLDARFPAAIRAGVPGWP